METAAVVTPGGRETDSCENGDPMMSETLSIRRPVMDFRVLPDLHKSVGGLTGRESTHDANDWTASVNRVANFNCWPCSYRLQFVRAEPLESGLLVELSMIGWSTKPSFNVTFIRKARASDR